MFGHDIRGPTSILKELWMMPKKMSLSVVQYLQHLRERRLNWQQIRSKRSTTKLNGKLKSTMTAQPEMTHWNLKKKS